MAQSPKYVPILPYKNPNLPKLKTPKIVLFLKKIGIALGSKRNLFSAYQHVRKAQTRWPSCSVRGSRRLGFYMKRLYIRNTNSSISLHTKLANSTTHLLAWSA